MKLYTIGFAKKTARQFFTVIKNRRIDLLLDVRLNNKSQLAGYTKEADLIYFLKEICGCAYEHRLDFAPTKEFLDGYRDKELSWDEYERRYTGLIKERGICDTFCGTYSQYDNIVLLCSEPTSDKCHRRLAAQLILERFPDISLEHL